MNFAATLARFLATSMALLLLAWPAAAQTFTQGELPPRVAQGDLDVPQSPAFFALGLTPESVSRPASGRELAGAILSGLDKQGNFQSGVAIDTAPYLLILGNDLTINEYRADYMDRFLSRTTFSFATTKGTGSDDKSVRAGAGLRFVPFNAGDPRQDLELDTCFSGLSFVPSTAGEGVEERELRLAEAAKPGSSFMKKLEEQVGACLNTDAEQFWNASALEFGVSPTLIQEDGASSDTQYAGTAFWGSYAQALGKKGQAIFTGRFKQGDYTLAPGDDRDFERQDALSLATQIRFGRAKQSIYIEGAYNFVDPNHASVSHGGQASVGTTLAFPWIDNVWMNLGVGWSGGSNIDEKIFLLTTLKFGNGSKVDLSRLATAAAGRS